MRFLTILAALSMIAFAPGCSSGGDTSSTGTETGNSDTTDDGSDASAAADAGQTGADTSGGDTAPPCEPQCDGKNCGENGCGGLCGTCFGAYTCEEGVCTACEPACDGKDCGDDGCGGSCGTCEETEFCHPAGLCGPPPPAICLEMAPCLITACTGFDGDIATCIENEKAACGPTETPAEEAAAIALVTCMADSACPFADAGARAECQRSSCLPETIACSQQVEGEVECHMILQCIDGDDCPSNFVTGEPTITCIADCLASGTADAVQKYWELMLCVDAQCLDSTVYDDMELCFNEETDTGGACGWFFRDCLMSAM